MAVLVVNAGSTSLKLHLVEDEESRPVHSLNVDCEAVAHRVVWGGELLTSRPAWVVDDEVEGELAKAIPIAPLHNRPMLEALGRVRESQPDVPHVAVLDSHFHHTIPPQAATYALPQRLVADLKLVRHGFHGLSIQWAVERVPVSRLVVCHLGGGCSVTAVRDGRSADTTMGFTPLEGVPMATRAGSVDPGILLYLLREGTKTVDDLDHILEYESGLLGLSGVAGGIREVEASDKPAAELALEVFTYRIATSVGAMATALGGLDALVFTAGVGEGSSSVRARVCDRLGFLGVLLDRGANAGAVPDAEISAADSRVAVHVIRAREELVAARAASAVLGS